MSAEIIEKIRKSVLEGRPVDAVTHTKGALSEGLSPKIILEEGLMPGIRRVGELFSEGEYYLPELMVSGKAMEAAVKELEPFLGKEGGSSRIGKYLIGTVKGDIHDIGKKIVIMMLKGSGWDVTDLGVDLPPEKVCDAIKTGNYDVFGMSTLLTVSMPAARDTIEAIKKAGLRDKIRIMIGGAPVTEEFADKIGADAYGKDAYEAVTKAELLVTQKR